MALVGIIAILVLLAAILSSRVSPIVALVVVPIVASLVLGFGLETSKFMAAGVGQIAPIAPCSCSPFCSSAS